MAGSSQNVAIMNKSLPNLGFSAISDLSSAKGLAGGTLTSIPAGTIYAHVQADSGDVRMRGDGTAPTSDTGHLIAEGDSWWVFQADLSKVQLIAAEEGSKAMVTFYGV